MPLTNPISVTYGDFTAGGGSSSYQLIGPYVIDKSFTSLRVVFDVIVVASSVSGLKSLSDSLETAMAKRDQDLTISMDGSDWTYTQGQDMLNSTGSAHKSGNRETDHGNSRAYSCTVTAELPAIDKDGLRELHVDRHLDAGRRQVVTMQGVYTGSDAGTAQHNYETNFDAEATTILTAIGGSVTWELEDEQFTHDRLNYMGSFSRQYVQLLAPQSQGTTDDDEIRDHRIIFTDYSQHPGDSKQGIHRLRRVDGRYDCAIDIEKTTDLHTVYTAKVKPHVLQLFQSNFSPNVFCIEEEQVSYDETSKRMAVSLKLLYKKQGGENVVSVSQSVAIRELRTLDRTPVHNGDEFAAELDVGWAVRERVWSRVVIVIGTETPKRRIGERAQAGDAGLFTDALSGEPGVDQSNQGTVQQDGWTIVSNESEVHEEWVGDPDGDHQIQTSILTEKVVEQYNRKPGSGTSSNPITHG